MSAPVQLGGGGLTGWMMLKRTGALQRKTVAQDPVVARSTAYFRQNIGKIKSADDLVKDYRLLGVTLGAFGLEADVGNKALIRKVLEADRSDSKSLVNRMTDKRYGSLSDCFQLSEGTGVVRSSGFADQIAAQFEEREFERRVGETYPELRLALNAQRELSSMSQRESSDRTLWYEVMGNPPLRRVFETALNCGSQFSKLPIDRQLKELMTRAEKVLGSSSFKGYATPEGTEKLIRTFLVRSQLSGPAPSSPYANALTLLGRG